MAKFIIDTDVLAREVNKLSQQDRVEKIIKALRAAHRKEVTAPWLTPYKEKKSAVAAGTGPYSELFELFWEAYPARNGVKAGKRAAFKAWVKTVKSVDDEKLLSSLCLTALKWQVLTDDWRKDKGTFIPMASTYLNGERFLDERPKGLAAGKKMITNSEGKRVEVDI